MKKAVVGLLAHVDAGKTTLAEDLLYAAGAIRARGRVDHGDAHLDTAPLERERGITIFAKQAHLDAFDTHVMLVDAPGHVDFSAEAERTLQVLDYAILLVGANDGVAGRTETLWELLERYGVPTVVFVNKMDLAASDRTDVLAGLQARLSPSCLDGELLCSGRDAARADAGVPDAARLPVLEAAATTDDAALEEYCGTGALGWGTIQRLVLERRVAPVFFGSALRDQGVRELLEALCALIEPVPWPDELAARVYRVSRSARGERLAWLKVTGGVLRAKTTLEGYDGGAPWREKIDQIRVYQSDSFQVVQEVPAGRLCAVTGLSHVVPGSALGAEAEAPAPYLRPVLSYRVVPGDHDVATVVRALRELADEDPLLGVTWQEQLQEIRVQLMGEIQQEVLRETLAERYGLDVGFGPGGILYQETLSAPVEGVGHFEPLRHYAEVHLRLEPAPRGRGVEMGTRVSEDGLDRNWQRLILTHVGERTHRGVLVGAPLTDVRITLTAGRAHLKHTEGGDFRQATYRAIRQGLMEARERGACVLLEPWYAFCLVVPARSIGRALADAQRMGARFDPPETRGELSELRGFAPVATIRSYALEVSRYTSGTGRLSLEFSGYEPCHDAEEVIAAAAYDPAADAANTPDSVFCAHGAGYNVPWRDVPARAHVQVDPARLRPWRCADASFFAR